MKVTPVRRAFAAAAAASTLAVVAACGSDSASPSGESDEREGASGAYDDGTYTATGDYTNPGGLATIDVELTIEGNEVTAVTVTPTAAGGNSLQFQTQFAGGVADEVVGRPLDEVEVDTIAGSSLTGVGFNDAVAQIKDEAGG